MDLPLTEPDWELYTDGISFMENGHRQVTYVVVTIDEVIEALALAIRTSAQKAELIALTTALELTQEKSVNIYTDSNSSS